MRKCIKLTAVALTACLTLSVGFLSYANVIYAPGVIPSTTSQSESDSYQGTGSDSAGISDTPAEAGESQYPSSGRYATFPASDQTTGTESGPGDSVADTASQDTSTETAEGGLATGLTGDNLSNTDITTSFSSTQVDSLTGYAYAPILHGQYLLSTGDLTEGFTSEMGAFDSPEEGFVGIKFRLEYSIGDVYYRVFRDGLGWGAWATNDMTTPFSGESNKVTAIQLRINGHTGNLYNLYYRVVLSDGSVLGWARETQTAGTIGTGLYIQQVQTALYPVEQEFPGSTSNYFYGDSYEGLIEDTAGGLPTYSTWDGSAYTGWAYDTSNNKYYFNQGAITVGWAYIDGYKYYFDEQGKVMTDLEPIIGLTGDYILKLNKGQDTLTVYARDGENGYIMPVKVILVTTGPDTPLGDFTTYASYRWHFMHDDIYCQYLLRFYNGCLLHSVIYNGSPSPYSLNANTYNQLGKNQSDGCVRMVAGNAAWIYTNCGIGTKLNIYYDQWTSGPFDKPAIQQAIPLSQNYDPTDPVVIADLAAKGVTQ